MSNGHTPGPWRMDHDGSNWMVVTDDYPEMVDVWGFNGMPAVEVVANVRLIAAAPDLLEALDDLLIAYCDPGNQGGDHDDKVEAARAALAKAKGQPCQPAPKS